MGKLTVEQPFTGWNPQQIGKHTWTKQIEIKNLQRQTDGQIQISKGI